MKDKKEREEGRMSDYQLEKDIARIKDRIEFLKRVRDEKLNAATEAETESKNHRGYGYELIFRNEAERFLKSALHFEEKIAEDEKRLRSLISKKEEL